MSKQRREMPTPTVAVWLGTAAPLRSIRWLDGAIAAAAKIGPAIAIAAGESSWLDVASDRARSMKVASAGVKTDLKLDYLGWAQIVAATMRELGLTMLLVDEASRRDRFAEVAAIAELLDAVQLTHVVAIANDGPVVLASRVCGRELQTLRVRGPAVLGVRIAGPAIDEYPTPLPTGPMKRFDLDSLGLDPRLLSHRALPPASHLQPKQALDRIAEHLAVHLAPRGA